MSAASDIILLSSPPVCPSRTPAPPSYDPGKIFGISPRGSSPASVLSPSELFRPLSQSRYFKASTKNGKTSNIKKNKTSSEGAAETNLLNFKRKDAVLENGAKRRRTKKLSSERVTVPSELEPSTPDRRGNTSKKSTATKKKHTDGPSKCGKTTNKTLTGRIAKADSVQTRKSDEKIDCPCTPKSSQEKIAKGTFGWEKEGLQLDVATKRRFDWTPTKDTIDQATEVEEIGSAERPSNRFGTLLAEYNFSDSSSAAHNNTRSLEAGAFTKRRRIELVDSSLNPVSKAIAPSTDKPLTDNDQSTTAYKPKKRLQKQSKKLTTLTARVTARYNEDLAEIPDLTATHKDGTSANTKSSKSKAREKTKSAPQEPEFIVLSPEAATKCLDDQDLIFGTCSQLQREDSPKLRRETQTAFYESEKSNTAEPVSSHIQSTRSKTSSSTTISRFTAPRNLWSIAARDSEGSLAQVAVLNLSGESGLSETSATNYNHTSRQKSRNKDAGTVGSIGSNDISEPNEISSTKKGLSTGASQIINNTTEKTNSQTAVPRPTMPRYGGFTDAELSKQIATYGFKPLRNRQKMIELLQKCWESKHGKDSNGDNEKEQQKFLQVYQYFSENNHEAQESPVDYIVQVYIEKRTIRNISQYEQ
ncbi:hypothetical protein EYZ11_007477 [Aspergillus tanneri]|uniref:Structure-specific endonuclease subunit SLX4 n=1 Tax=Aspergillus tanneri TaxID=1220188 RepID=A0A4S3JIJ7_9EURO|nr:hypothetical protein EYZ11_007477 [Aspergillus tanneri]